MPPAIGVKTDWLVKWSLKPSAAYFFQADVEHSSVTVDEEDLYIYLYGEAGIYPQPVAAPYDVSGEITLADGTPLAGVEVIVHGHPNDAVTGSDGQFSFADIAVATVLEPMSDDYVFRPKRHVITEATDVQFCCGRCICGHCSFP